MNDGSSDYWKRHHLHFVEIAIGLIALTMTIIIWQNSEALEKQNSATLNEIKQISKNQFAIQNFPKEIVLTTSNISLENKTYDGEPIAARISVSSVSPHVSKLVLNDVRFELDPTSGRIWRQQMSLEYDGNITRFLPQGVANLELEVPLRLSFIPQHNSVGGELGKLSFGFTIVDLQTNETLTKTVNSTVVYPRPIFLSVNKLEFYEGETVVIYGQVNNPKSGESLQLDIANPRGITFFSFKTILDTKGRFSTSLPLEKPSMTGIYTAKIRYQGSESQMTFRVLSTSKYHYSLIHQWGTYGHHEGQFSGPSGIALSNLGIVYVVDSGNNRVQMFDDTGSYLRSFGTYGHSRAQFDRPSNIALDSQGNVYVVDAGNSRIQKLSANGTFIGEWHPYGESVSTRFPAGIAIDDKDDIYLADSEGKIQILRPDGSEIRSFEIPFNSWPVSIAVDGRENTLVGDYHSGNVLIFDSKGNSISTVNYPQSLTRIITPFVAVDNYDNIFVADYFHGEITRFDAITYNQSPITLRDTYPSAVVVDKMGKVYVTDQMHDRVLVLQTD